MLVPAHLCRWRSCSESVVGFLRDYMEPLLQDMAPLGVGESGWAEPWSCDGQLGRILCNCAIVATCGVTGLTEAVAET